MSNYNAGEILPYFNIDYDFYKTFFKSFALNDNIIDSCDIKVKSREVDEKIMKSFTCVTNVELFAYRYIYSMLIKEKESIKTKTIIDFLEEHQDSPLFSIVIFIAIIYKSNMFRNGLDVWKNYLKRTYENCLSYTLSIEQLIENSLFYAGNGILSIRIHRKDSDAMKTICCKEKIEAKDIYMIEISLIDFQENIKDKSIKSCFIKNACVTDLERESLKSELNKSDDLSDLFFYNNSNKVLNSYLNKPEVILQHYGLQTIGLLAKKTKSFFHMKSGKNYVPNSTGDMFLVQDKEQYPYNSGTLYRIIIPVTNKNEVQDSYSGIHSNKYETEEIDIKSIDILSSNVDDIIPKNREEKVLIVNKYRQLLSNEYESNKILSINVQKIDSRLYLECIVKASLDLLYSSSNKNIAIVGLRSKTFLKIALRFIVLSYTKLEKNNVFKDNEIFLCTDDCKTQILISGENLSDIIENLSSQRIFGAIDDDIFKEVSLTLETITGRS